MGRIKISFFSWVLLLIVGAISCGQEIKESDLIGTWRVVLDSPGGELPFILVVSNPQQEKLTAVVRNGEELLPFSTVEWSVWDRLPEADVKPNVQVLGNSAQAAVACWMIPIMMVC